MSIVVILRLLNQDNWLSTRCLFMALSFNSMSNDEIIATLNGLKEEMYKTHNLFKTYEQSSDVLKFYNFNFKKNIHPDLHYYNGNMVRR